ncbi:hypothetical protein [Clostridium beijerinckii]|uniref:hypothetical protein n=1 Tax=Clostridium beijerinckii TaxID=1520 RepID=UPI00232C697E|nr:hypothetical protein [Clostridium beijerinckii]
MDENIENNAEMPVQNADEENTNKTNEEVQEDNSMSGEVKEEKYNTQYLIDNCKALGYKKEIVAGALFGCDKTEMTKSEFESTIKEFLGKKVK